MPAYKYKLKNNSTRWYVKINYQSHDGTNCQKVKRGFKTKREAVDYERQYKQKYVGSIDMRFKDFVEIYFSDNSSRLKQTTIQTKRNCLEKHVIPVIGDRKIVEIAPADIQNLLNSLELKESTINRIKAVISSVFNHAVKYYGLDMNPCFKVSGRNSSSNINNIWSLKEFQEFISHVDSAEYRLAYEVMFYTGIRIGELLALNKCDIDANHNLLRINKNLQFVNNEWSIQSVKTNSSVRDITLPDKLTAELIEYSKNMDNTERLFKYSKNSYKVKLDRVCKEFGVKRIRLHDLRHSHASLLISLGYEPIVIADRLGHKSIKTTLDTYSHIYDTVPKNIARKLNELL